MKKCFSFVFALSALIFAQSCCNSGQQTAGVRTSALDDSCWNSSQWISAADAPVVEGEVKGGSNYRSADGASWFLAKPVNSKELLSAKWMASGLGVFQLFVNGRPVGEEVLKPGFTHHAKTKYSFTYDVTDAFNCRSGAVNEISAQLTPGWWGDKIVTPGGHDGMIGRKCAFRSVLELCYTDGSRELFGTDTSNWKAGIAGPVTHAGIFDGESFDAGVLPGFETPELLSEPELNTEFSGRILPSAGAEVYLRRDLALKPVEAYTWKDVEGASEESFGKIVKLKEFRSGAAITLEPGETLVVDFGQNAAAVPSFVFKAKAGTHLVCLPGEILNDGNGSGSRGMDGPEGSVHRTNLRTPDDCFRVDYTFGSARGFVSYTTSCCFFGYRFVSITEDNAVVITKLESVPVTSIAANLETGSITTGNDLVNKIISNSIWGQRSNYLSVPTDCPQRNERLGWTADTQVFTETGTFFANTDAFFHKWMRDMRDSQSPTGAFPGVAPTAQYGGDMMRLGWADAGIIVPWTVWKQFGDTSIVDENWDSMEKYIDHVNETKFDQPTVAAENGNYQWADWLSYEPLESCGGGAFLQDGKRTRRPEAIEYWSYLGASYWAMDAGMMLDMARASGRDAGKYEAMEAAAKAYIKERFLRADGSFKVEILNTMQTPALFALKNHLLEGEALEAVKGRLRSNFAAHDNCLQTGFLGTSILMDVLTENGMSDIAYELLLQRKNPSWIYSIDNGATTIWERWNSYTLENGMGPKGMNSFNHYAYGAVCAWIWKTVAGIASDTATPGFGHVIMKPVPDRRLGHVQAEYRSAAGLIRSAWRYEGDTWVWNFTIPEGATASVTLPGEDGAVDYESGTYEIIR